MHFLQVELEENDGLRQIVYGLSQRSGEIKGKMGLILDLNPFWYEAIRLRETGLDPNSMLRFFPDIIPAAWAPLLFHFQSTYRLDTDPPDLLSRFSIVEMLNEHLTGRNHDDRFQPFILRLIARPNIRTEDRAQLLNMAAEMQILTLVQSHDVPELVGAPGSQLMSAGIQGTLGGYLRDGKSKSVFAVSCGHAVSGQGGQVQIAGKSTETVVHVHQPTPLPTNVSCHAACGSVTDLDLALISTNNIVENNVVSSVAKVVGNGQLVEMEGASSGVVKYEIGGIVIDYEIGGSCWKKLIQFHAPISGILPAAVKIATTTLPRSGDSGAWLVRNGNEWAGMVVAANALHGFALPATHLLNQADAEFGANLVLV